jgi:hypothetical protein
LSGSAASEASSLADACRKVFDVTISRCSPFTSQPESTKYVAIQSSRD